MSSFINILTLSRILLAPVIFILIAIFEFFWLALVLFFIASITDYLDGLLARKYNLQSKFGEVIDPIADKILVIFLFVALSVHLSSFYIGFAASIIISREIWVGALRNLNSESGNSDATKVLFISKLKTSIQLSCITLYLLGLSLNNMLILVISDFLILISVLITIYTGYLYTVSTFKKQ